MIVSAGSSPVTNEQANEARRRSGAVLYAAAAFASAFLFSGGAHAASYQFGEMNLSIDTTVTAGVTLRASARDCTKYNTVNGGCLNGDGRGTSINSMLGASAVTIHATRLRTRPSSSGRRRPHTSSAGPMKSCVTANTVLYTVIDIKTSAVLVCRLTSMDGKDGM